MALKLPHRGPFSLHSLLGKRGRNTTRIGHVSAPHSPHRAVRGPTISRSEFLGVAFRRLIVASPQYAEQDILPDPVTNMGTTRGPPRPVTSASLNSNAAAVEALPRGTSEAQPKVVKTDSHLDTSAPLAYELIQGPLVRWSATSRNPAYSAPPTAVLLHGILGSRKNWSSFARKLAREFPSWQMLLVDLRCHGESATSAGAELHGPHSVEAAAGDVLRLIRHLKLVPQVLVGHSFGGKVALSMVDQAPKPLAKPVQVWVLDATPGDVHAGGDGEDHPRELIHALAAMHGPITDRKAVVAALRGQGFSEPISQWMTTNLKPAEDRARLEWCFDLPGIAEMYESYEATNMWPLVENVPEGVRIEFLRAERSLHRWAHGDVQRISVAEMRASREGAGVRMHMLEDAGHWVHADNPDGLFRILAPSFGGGHF